MRAIEIYNNCSLGVIAVTATMESCPALDKSARVREVKISMSLQLKKKTSGALLVVLRGLIQCVEKMEQYIPLPVLPSTAEDWLRRTLPKTALTGSVIMTYSVIFL